jgi:hypothetical protein
MYGPEIHARPNLNGSEDHANLFLNIWRLVETAQRPAQERVENCTEKVLRSRTSSLENVKCYDSTANYWLTSNSSQENEMIPSVISSIPWLTCGCGSKFCLSTCCGLLTELSCWCCIPCDDCWGCKFCPGNCCESLRNCPLGYFLSCCCDCGSSCLNDMIKVLNSFSFFEIYLDI